jgi:hypothetical protein
VPFRIILSGAEIQSYNGGEIMVVTGATSEPTLSQPWSDANFAQIKIGRGKLDAFEWSLYQNSTRAIVDILKGTRTQIIEVAGKSGELWGAIEDTHVYMVTNPLIHTQSIVDHVKECLSGIAREFDQDEIALVLGTLTLVGA